jgi:hypothetical protein
MRRILVLLSFAVAASLAQADEQKWSIDSLRGLRALDVVVDPLPHDAEKDGLRRPALQADIELRLRRLGITIVTEKSAPWPDSAVMRLRVDDLKRDLEQGSYHEFRLTLEVLQSVALLRDPAVRSVNAQWHRTSEGTQLTTLLVRSVRDSLRELIEHFVDDYLAANGFYVRKAPVVASGKRKKRRPEGD